MVIYMIQTLISLSSVSLALLAGLFTFLVTALGAAMVFFFKKVNSNLLDAMLSVAAGIMLSAAFFSLLNPSIEIASSLNQNLFFVVFLGFLFGVFFIFLCNKIFHRFSFESSSNFNLKRCLLLITSITLHNIPEGLAVGVAFGTILYGQSFLSAVTLTLGIAIQNFPEGSAISLPLRREGMSRMHSFALGALSGIVEPISAVIGAFLVLKIQVILPFVLSFAAGAMLYVTVLELIPESQKNKNKDFMALVLNLGFSIMMLLEIFLG